MCHHQPLPMNEIKFHINRFHSATNMMSHYHQPLSQPFKDQQRSIHLITQCNSTSTNRHENYHLCTSTSNDYNPEARRSANYQPSLWDYDFIQSLKSQYTEEQYTERAEKLKEGVRHMFKESHEWPLLSLLKLVDVIQRLTNIDHHFFDEIKVALDTIVSTEDMDICGDLYTIALRFRLLRQHGYEVSQDVFLSFGDKLKRGDLKHVEKLETEDVTGMLSLYEASFFASEGEDILDEAQQLTVRHLNKFISTTNPHSMISKQVRHALELPLQWRAPRYETSWFLSIYAHTSTAEEMDPLLFEFAKLDFNMVSKAPT
ncbi:alpha-terpineol synthase, chloroplastic-like [Papaver somniferum]|uniref:alpha-terpineol synthase, chloroplastic-like n=1 Tax=Papaver somniferum TaxID=3469 RepID=UPI000E6F82B9|nr:alpha-terpineol synthase, chloroplastic-like [Papaver somniferum]